MASGSILSYFSKAAKSPLDESSFPVKEDVPEVSTDEFISVLGNSSKLPERNVNVYHTPKLIR